MLQALVPGLLYTAYHPLRVAGLPLGRRMTAARGADGRWVIFSPLPANLTTLSDLFDLGEIGAFVIPNRFHDRFYDGYFRAFPQVKFLAGAAVCADHPHWPLTSAGANHHALPGFKVMLMRGMPRVQEQVFLHEASRTLIVADLFFNLPYGTGFFERLLLKAADMGGEARPSRLWRRLIKDPAAFRTCLEDLLSWDFERIIPGHGYVIERDGTRRLWEAYAPWLGQHRT